MHPKDAEGIANSVDPDQTAPSLIWVCTVCPDLSVRKLRKISTVSANDNLHPISNTRSLSSLNYSDIFIPNLCHFVDNLIDNNNHLYLFRSNVNNRMIMDLCLF